MSQLSIVVPVLNEASVLPRLIRVLASLHPAPCEIILVDGRSSDNSVALAAAAGWRVVASPTGRGVQINAGVTAATGALVCVLHADTLPPDDMVAVIERVMADPQTALAGFTPLIAGDRTTRWGTSFHNWIKTWYAPLLFRPHLFWRGTRLLFGDHALFFRRTQFLAIGGCDERLRVMEDADLSVRFGRIGRVRLINRVVLTSDRRVARWGAWRANWIYLSVGIRWGLGRRRGIARDYPDIR